MPAPTNQNIFGANAQVITGNASITADPSNPALVIYRNDFAQWTTSDGSKPERWLIAILRSLIAWLSTNTDDLPDVEGNLVTRTLATRNSTDKIGFIYQITLYNPASGLPSAPDSDNI
jgi:hypothetical protein